MHLKPTPEYIPCHFFSSHYVGKDYLTPVLDFILLFVCVLHLCRKYQSNIEYGVSAGRVCAPSQNTYYDISVIAEYFLTRPNLVYSLSFPGSPSVQQVYFLKCDGFWYVYLQRGCGVYLCHTATLAPQKGFVILTIVFLTKLQLLTWFYGMILE